MTDPRPTLTLAERVHSRDCGCRMGRDLECDAIAEEVGELERGVEQITLVALVNRAEAAEKLLAEATDKLQRIRDALKYQANSEGGLVAEVDDVLRRVRAAGKETR